MTKFTKEQLRSIKLQAFDLARLIVVSSMHNMPKNYTAEDQQASVWAYLDGMQTYIDGLTGHLIDHGHSPKVQRGQDKPIRSAQ